MVEGGRLNVEICWLLNTFIKIIFTKKKNEGDKKKQQQAFKDSENNK